MGQGSVGADGDGELHAVLLREGLQPIQEYFHLGAAVGTVALTLMSVEKPAVDGDTVAFGALAAAAVTGADKIVTEAVPIADPRLRQAWPDTLYRTRIYFTQQLSLVIG